MATETVKITGVLKSNGFQVEREVDLTVNLLLRDLFAAFALNALAQTDFARSISHPDKAAEDAYKLADAMLAARGLETTKG